MFFLGDIAAAIVSLNLFSLVVLSRPTGTGWEQPELTRDPCSNGILGSERAGQDSKVGDKRPGMHRMHSRILWLANEGGCTECVVEEEETERQTKRA